MNTSLKSAFHLSGENSPSGSCDRARVCNKGGEGQWVDASAVHSVGGD